MAADLHSPEQDTVVKACEDILKSEFEDTAYDAGLCQALKHALESHSAIAAKICETIAYLARNETFRSAAADDGSLVASLTPLLKIEDSIDVQLQVLRALGNLCHEEDRCREQLWKAGGCPLLAGALERCTSLPVSVEYYRYKTVTSGCILNACHDNEQLCQAMIDLNAIEHLATLLDKKDDEMVLQMTLQALVAIVESEYYTNKEISSSHLPASLNNALSLCTSQEYDLTDHVLEIMETLVSDNRKACDYWRVAMTTAGCISQLLLFSGHLATEKAMNIIILIVTSDEAMAQVIKMQELWDYLRSTMKSPMAPIQLKASAALVVGNMARNSENCDFIIRAGMLKELVELLHTPVTEENAKIHYSALSVLRNLSLPEDHKMTFLQEGVVDEVIDVLEQSTEPHVIMKSIGCLRLLSTRNEVCHHVTIVKPVVKRVCSACESAIVDHIKWEGSRLIASLVKSGSQETIARVIEDGGTKWLLALLGNEYVQLKNEGLVALIMCSVANLDAFNKDMADSGCEDSIFNLLVHNTPEVVENCLTLLETILANDIMVVKLSTPAIKDKLTELTQHDKDVIKDKSAAILKKLQ